MNRQRNYLRMKLVRLELLKPIEEFSQIRITHMKEKLIKKGFWIRPICIEEKYWLILDGHHRYNVAKQLDYKYLPCEFFDYNDENLVVWSLRKDCIVTKKLVIEKSLNGNIYPYKTAKHKFPILIEKCMIPLNELQKYNRYDHDIIEFDWKDKI